MPDFNKIVRYRPVDRQKRINRMKKAIIIALVVVILTPVFLSIFLLYKINSLEKRIDFLYESKIQGMIQEKFANNLDIGFKIERVNVSQVESGQEKTLAGTGNSREGQEAQEEAPQSRRVYLTFDDGPSQNTEKILDILAETGVKATFFVVGRQDEYSMAMYQRIVQEGHSLGMHSFSHQYSVIYASKEAFIEDLNKIRGLLAEAVGFAPTLYRFPGGSSNQVSNTDIRELARYLEAQGIRYFDWNVANKDATSATYTADELVANVMNGLGTYQEAVVLMHDAADKDTTVESLGSLIRRLKEVGADIRPITADTGDVQHLKIKAENAQE